MDKYSNPGPRTYLPQILNKVKPKFAIEKAIRKSPKNVIYTDKFYDSVNFYEGPSIKFGLEQRNKSLNKSNSPGPGSYETINCIGDLPEYARNHND